MAKFMDHGKALSSLPSRVGAGAGRDIAITALVSTAHTADHFLQLVLPSLFPLLKNAFGVSYAELGLLMTVFYATSGLSQTAAGFLVDRVARCRFWPVGSA